MNFRCWTSELVAVEAELIKVLIFFKEHSFRGCLNVKLRIFYSCSLQSEQERAYICVHHGLPHCALSSPYLRALLQTDDSQVHGDRNQLLWHVSRRLPQRVSMTAMHLHGYMFYFNICNKNIYNLIVLLPPDLQTMGVCWRFVMSDFFQTAVQ